MQTPSVGTVRTNIDSVFITSFPKSLSEYVSEQNPYFSEVLIRQALRYNFQYYTESTSGLVGSSQSTNSTLYYWGLFPYKRMPFLKSKQFVCSGMFCFIATLSSPVSFRILSVPTHTGHTRKLVDEIQYLFQTPPLKFLDGVTRSPKKVPGAGFPCLTKAPWQTQQKQSNIIDVLSNIPLFRCCL